MAKKKDPALEPAQQWKPEDDPWYQQAAALTGQLQSRPAFSYDPGSDPLYRAAESQAVRQGRRAMADTMGKAAGLTGGYASTYAQSLGQQAYDRQIEALAQRLPDYYDRARAAYDGQTKALRDSIGAVTGLYDLDYQAWLDGVKNARQDREDAQKAEQWQMDFDRDNAQWQQNFEEKLRQWELEYAQSQAQWQDKQDAAQASSAAAQQEKERSYAYRMAMLALQHGLKVSDALLKTAGIDKTYAEAIRRYYAAQH